MKTLKTIRSELTGTKPTNPTPNWKERQGWQDQVSRMEFPLPDRTFKGGDKRRKKIQESFMV